MAPTVDRSPGRAQVAALACVLGLGFFWGTSSLVGKVAVTSGALPIGYAFWQCVVASLILGGICVLRGTRLPLDALHVRYYLLGGLFGLAIPTSNMFIVLQQVPAGITAIVMTISPLITYSLALTLRMERFQPLRIAGIACGLTGALLLVLPRGSLPAPGMVSWVALTFLTPFCYATTNVMLARHMPSGTDRLALCLGLVLAALVGLAVAALATGSFFWLRLTPGPVEGAVLWQGTSTALAYIIYLTALRLAGPVYVSQVGYITVMVGMAGGMVLFGERHSEWIWAALACILTGLALVNLGQRRAARQAALAKG